LEDAAGDPKISSVSAVSVHGYAFLICFVIALAI